MTWPPTDTGIPKLSSRRASMRQVADHAGVSMSSVSRVLSGHPDVSPAMRERVLSSVRELGYEPNLLAQSLRRNETLSVGFVVGDIGNPLLAEIVSGAETGLRAAGYSMLLTNSEGDPALDVAHVRLFEQRRVDGLILSTSDDRGHAVADVLRQLRVPVVLVDRVLPADIGASRALSDHRSGMGEAIAHLLELGHRRIALVTGSRVRPALERLRALEDVFAAAGLPKTYLVEEGEFSAEHGEQALHRLLDLAEPPTAVIAGGNQIMVGALRAVTARGIELGHDLSFVGCDDVPIAELHRPPIAVVRRDNRELGTVAAELLLRRLQGDDEPVEVVLPTHFTARASCSALV